MEQVEAKAVGEDPEGELDQVHEPSAAAAAANHAQMHGDENLTEVVNSQDQNGAGSDFGADLCPPKIVKQTFLFYIKFQNKYAISL